MPARRIIGLLLGGLVLFSVGTPAAVAQPNPAEAAPAGDAEAGTPPSADQQSELAAQQTQLAERFRKIEELLLRLADVEVAENPERAALLRRAAKQSREKFILDRLNSAAASLSSEEYQKAITDQKAAQQELTSLLKLLMTENRPERIREEKERVTRWIKDLKRLERLERGIRARAENGAELSEIESEQKSVTERTQELETELKDDADAAQEAAPSQEGPPLEGEPKEGEPKAGESKEGESKEGESQEGESKEGEPKEGESKEGESKEGESKEGEAKEGESKEGESKEGESSESQSQPSESSESQSKEGQPQEGQSQEGQSGDSQPQQEKQPSTPKEAAQQALQQARQNMERAQQKLDEAKREEAVEAQRQAEQELREAIERLERILRQLREEEMLRELARIESRLRKMAQMQTEVLDKTQELAKTPAAQRNRQTDIRAGNLAFEEKKIVLEADRAVLLLREEGSSVAFPEVVQQMRGDMVRVAERLTQTKIDVVTQGLQEDILAALEEMIAALQQAQRDLEKQQQQQQQGQSQQAGQPGEQPLVPPIAELKLIRTMQTRIKSITERYGAMIPDDPAVAPDEDLLGLLQNLSTRQQRLYRITRDLLLRRNE